MNLNALDTEDFSNFPSDPFPSQLICFSNTSKITQEQQWQNLTLPWSPSCNYTFTAGQCNADIKEKNRLILILMIAFPSVGFGFFICCGFICSGFGNMLEKFSVSDSMTHRQLMTRRIRELQEA